MRWIIGKPLSADLRKRIVADINSGNTRRGAASRFGVAASTAINLQAGFEEMGSVEPSRIGRPRDRGKLGAHRDFIIGHGKKRPDITMPELAALLLAERSIEVDPSNLSKFLCPAVGHVCDQFTPQECWNDFKATQGVST